MTALLLVAVTTLAAPPAQSGLDVGASLGAGRSRQAVSGAARASLAVALSVGGDLAPLAGLPARLELLLATSTLGVRGEGVNAMSVASLSAAMSLLGGVAWPVAELDDLTLGPELYVGPALAVTRVLYRVEGRSETTLDFEPRVAYVAGAFTRAGRWRVALRLLSFAPRGRERLLLATAARAW